MLAAGSTIFIYFVVTPLQRDIERAQVAHATLQREMIDDFKFLRENTISYREHQQFVADQRSIADKQVTRAELEQRWRADAAATEVLRLDLQRLQQRISEQYNAGDLLKEISKRIHELEIRMPVRPN